ncbi:TetR/AcrR family transcriptional regulator [Nonomuraea wenchangensis]|uniref:DNA-binding transcriptional regulator, AcrR family n=1 Tax=Nonomuraea wenchangensis TaxID=568860 RepID=A0A1I0L6K5_9ACTN|nr:TetR/AcrR family transcriptional regulator [Nonomuraea wenchangensis]SEU34701.1 DNA-binding transcriptional regulator, AcrR family [Nonomuraea wenchangensis]
MSTRTGRPPKISRREIVTAALRVIEEDGTGALTMRRLAREVGSTAMALYHHVRDKEELLLLLLDDYAAAIPRPALPDEPRERMVAAAMAMHDAVSGCPWAVDILKADDLMSVGALWYPEQIVDAAVHAGLTIEEAVDVYRIIWHYTAGEIGGRAAARRRREEGGPTYRERVFAELDAEEFPRLSTVARRWEDLTARDTYAKGVRAIVNGLLP